MKFALFGASLLSVAGTLFGLSSCSGNRQNDRISQSDNTVTEEYHADNDIVMTLRSLIDAVRVDEPLDSVEYDFEGVLTDGSGRPLYTDLQGSPGIWEVEVTGSNSAFIRNVYLGDLLPDDLQQYIISQIDVSPGDEIVSSEYDDDDEAQLSLYDFGNGYLRFETRNGRTISGLEGPLLTIRITPKE